MNANKIIELVIKILYNKPLCDHCLGRLFARLGMGLGNNERGYSLKTIVAMIIHEKILEEEPGKYRDLVYRLAINGGGSLTKLFSHVYGEEVETKKCYVCNGKLSIQYFNTIANKVAETLNDYHPTSFLVGVTISRDLQLKELEISSKTGIEYSESIKNELKREIGKRVKELLGIEPDFVKPDVVAIIDFSTDNINVVVRPVLLEGVYWKQARNISHTRWITRGIRKYPYSLEDFLNDYINPLYDAERTVLHASGREDVDVRMIGTGRPMVIEVKNPRYRLVDPSLINEFLSTRIIKVEVHGFSSRKRIEYLKTEHSKRSKIYKALVYTGDPIDHSKLLILERELENRVINQYTPTRILWRKKEKLRKKKVYRVKTRYINRHLFETIIWCDGGLYIKELISGDNERTEPSFSSILGTSAYCIELDVIAVID